MRPKTQQGYRGGGRWDGATEGTFIRTKVDVSRGGATTLGLRIVDFSRSIVSVPESLSENCFVQFFSLSRFRLPPSRRLVRCFGCPYPTLSFPFTFSLPCRQAQLRRIRNTDVAGQRRRPLSIGRQTPTTVPSYARTKLSAMSLSEPKSNKRRSKTRQPDVKQRLVARQNVLPKRSMQS